MSIEIRYQVGSEPTDAEIIRQLNEQYPNKIFTIGSHGTVVESYRGQPDYSDVLAHWKRVQRGIGVAATVVQSREDLDRMMSSAL